MDREKFLSLVDYELKPFTIPAWGSFFLKRLSIADAVYLNGLQVEDALRMAHACCRAIVKENGERIFRDEDAEAILAKNPENVSILLDELASFCNPLKNAEDLAKNC